MQIVNCVQSSAQNLIDLLKVMQISTREVAAAVAVAALVKRTKVVFVLGVSEFDVAVASKEPAVSCITGRHHAVKHIDAAFHAFNQRVRLFVAKALF